ncbi:adenosylmethionine--8-amino-7-oxononanoate transaminase [Kribbella sp. NPDC023972]|uniref:adenosylmethionine--8-amino-7-oxononanoate transaminase n=1 Tax=Kribbella sp. NPDC023972 TaxID=3154795 RepID=UPI0033D0A372
MTEVVPTWQQRDAKAVWHPYTQQYTWLGDDPLVIERADGVWLTDVAGRRYLDGGASLWVTTYQHNDPRLKAAITAQLDQLDHSTFFGATHTPGIQLAERLVAMAPGAPDDWRRLTKVFFGSDGASMVDAAIKLAHQFSVQAGDRRDLVLHLEGSFHGDSVAGSSVAGGNLMRRTYGPLLLDVRRTASPAPGRGQDPAAAAQHAIEALERTLAEYGDQCCALIVEPMIQAAGGMYPYHPSFLQACRRLADQHGFLLICDEIAAGVARTGRMWATEYAGITPDVMLCGKGLSGGVLPISAMLATEQVASAFVGLELARTFFHGHTFAANPLACSAALENLRMVSELDLPQLAESKGAILGQLLEPLLELPAVADVRRLGIMTGIELSSRHPRAGFELCQRAQSQGIWLRPLGNVVVLLPPLAISSDELGHLVAVLTELLEKPAG